MILAYVLGAAPDPTIPTITPDFSAPFFKGLTMLASWVLAAGLVIAFIVLIVSVIVLSLKGVASSQMKALAGAALPWALGGLVLLSSLTGIMTWLVGLDFGFGTTFGGPQG